MHGILRDLIKSLKEVPARNLPTSQDDDALGRLDDRLSDLFEAGNSASCAVSIRPGDCKVWDGNLSVLKKPSPEDCGPLLESIAQEGGNLVPVVIRPLINNPEQPYELLVGNRRRFCVQWLNRNGRPEIRLNALVVDLSDEEAFRLADLENKDRDDIPELDRARDYKYALDAFYGGVQSQMAQALKISNSQLSRLLSLADLPDEIVAAFPSKDELLVRHSEVLAPILRRAERALMLDEAIRIAAEQEHLCASGEKLLSAATVLARLKQAGTASTPERRKPAPPKGHCLSTIETVPGGRAVSFVMPDFANIDEVLAELKGELLEHLKASKGGTASPTP